MKKHVLIATGLAVLSTSAFATKTRMTALGQDSAYGSVYIEDTRNVFRNASAANSMSNYVLTEWGTAAATSGDGAEGGMFREAGNFVWGLYFGNTINDQNTARFAADNSYMERDNELDLFLAGDAGVEWGVRLQYSKSKDEQLAFEKTQSGFGLGLGITMGDLEVWTNLDLSDKSEGATVATDKWEADLGLDLGVSYDWNAMTFWVEYMKTGHETSPSGTKTTETTDSTITLGLGRIYDAGNGARVFTDIRFMSEKEEVKPVGGTSTETTNTRLPVTIGFEADANSWLTWRGSVSQAVLFNSTERKTAVSTTKTTNPDGTTVAAGATLNFGKLKVDGTISGGASGTLNTDNILTNVAVHYWF